MSNHATIAWSDEEETYHVKSDQKSSSNEEQNVNNNVLWQPLKSHPNYEILVDFPHTIREIDTQRECKTWRDKTKGNYYFVHLDGKRYYLHRVIATHFISNTDNLPCVDHINHDRGNNHKENLRWCSYRHNLNNRYDQLLVDDIPDDSIKVDQFNGWTFEDLYFDDDTFYMYNGINFVFKRTYQNKSGQCFINVTDTSGKLRRIYFSKFKHEYELI